jgi:acyl carrier protein
MTPDLVRAAAIRVLGAIAPDADLAHLKADLGLREQMDLDSMDFLNFVIGLHKELQVEIPEADYPKLATLNGCISYGCARTAASC